jgi:tryptophan-rich sensory protein
MNTRLTIRITALTLLALIVGASTGLLTANAIPTWYAALNKPSFNPPNWIFGPVWTVLYVLIGLAGGIVWAQFRSPERDRAMSAWALQLALNALWTVLFFGLRSPLLALVEIVALLAAIRWYMARSQDVHPWAHHLLWPYLAWVGFAMVLNMAIVYLN